MKTAEIAVVVCTYQMPHHLERVLASLSQQTSAAAEGSLARRLEVVVSDDGSADETAATVQRFARGAAFPVRYVTHPRHGFQLSRCRNEGFLATTAPRILFLDGDCLVPPDHLDKHLSVLRPGLVTNGYCVRLDQATSERITVESVRSGEFLRCVSARELFKLRLMHLKAAFYDFLGHRHKPNLRGGNVGICREDFLRVNGLDENFRAWGGEDDDLGFRLRAAGVRIVSVLDRTRTFHLWHPPAPTRVDRHRDQHHFDYLYRGARLSRCMSGIEKRSHSDLRVRLTGRPADMPLARKFLASLGFSANARPDEIADLEFLFSPGAGRFTPRADVRIFVALDEPSTAQNTAGSAHVVLSRSGKLGSSKQLRLQLHDGDALVAALGGQIEMERSRRAA